MSVHELKTQNGDLYYRAEYDGENGRVHSRWFGRPSHDEIKKGAETTLNIQTVFKSRNLLNDITELETDWNDLFDWLADDWMPRMLANDLKRVAQVSPLHFREADPDERTHRVETFDFTMRLFDNQADAKQWLNKQTAEARR